MNKKLMFSSDKCNWTTPLWFFNLLDKQFHFTLDPCAENGNHKCNKYFTKKEDGLKQNWSKDIVFMNPPYNREVKKWIEKAYKESLKGAIVVCLIASRTDTLIWHDYIFPFAVQIRFIRGRLKFGNSKNSAPFPSAIVIFDQKNKYSKRIIHYKNSVNKIHH